MSKSDFEKMLERVRRKTAAKLNCSEEEVELPDCVKGVLN